MKKKKEDKKTLGINLLYNPSGGSLEQIKKIFEHLSEYDFNNFVIYATPNNLHLIDASLDAKIKIRCSRFAAINLITRTIWEQLLLPLYLLVDSVSVIFCPGNIAPILSFTKKAQWIGTIGPFEEEFVRIYSDYSLWKRFVLFFNKILMLLSAKTSNHVFFESFYTQGMFVKKYNFDGRKGSVLQIGKDDYFQPSDLMDNESFDSLIRKDYILSVSHLYPYKNIETLIHAFKRVNETNPDLVLVLAGSTQNIDYLNNLKKIVHDYELNEIVFFLGNLDRSDLKQYYSNCECLVFTSPFENFAYTLVEAMSCGAPIVSSNTTAMPETCMNAAIYFDPYSVDDLYQKINLMLSDPGNREKYAGRSIERSRELDSYKTINKQTNKILQSIL
jgi:glycosyltransferase involved in cell wall biosynthesis